MNIVYASDNGFAEYLGISMLSLFENNRGSSESINIYILDGGISQTNKEHLEQIAKSFDGNIYFLNVESLLKSDMKQQRGSLSTFSRLYLTELMPVNVDKVLYLDCDILVENSLEDMYNTELGDNYIAGVNDCVSDGHLENIGLKSGDNYFNAGVLLINLDAWRKDNIIEKFDNFLKDYNNDVPYADQGIVNGVMSHKSIKLSLEYNCYTALYDFKYNDLLTFRKPTVYYSEQEVLRAKEKPTIVHFTTSFLSLRPWIEGCEHEYVDKWLEYKMKTPWADDSLKKDNRSAKKKLALKIYKAMPNCISVRIAGLLHSRIVPMMKKKKH